MVDARCRETLRIEVVERAVWLVDIAGREIAVLERAVGANAGYERIVLVDIEVAAEKHREAFYREIFDFLLYKRDTLLAGFHADMVHMEIEIEELPSGRLVEEMPPCAHAAACGVPAKRRTVGCLGEPEVAMVEHVEHGRVVKYRGMFASTFAIVAANADKIISRQTRFQRIELVAHPFLGAEYIEIVKTNQTGNVWQACAPSVSFQGVGTCR